MKTAHFTLSKLSTLSASLLLAGLLGGNVVLANESTTGSSHSTMSSGDMSTHGGMSQDCPDDLKEDGNKCPEGWQNEGSRQNMPEQDGSSSGQGGSSTGGTGSGSGSGTTGGSTTGSGTSGTGTTGGSGTSGGTGGSGTSQ